MCQNNCVINTQNHPSSQFSYHDCSTKSQYSVSWMPEYSKYLTNNYHSDWSQSSIIVSLSSHLTTQSLVFSKCLVLWTCFMSALGVSSLQHDCVYKLQCLLVFVSCHASWNNQYSILYLTHSHWLRKPNYSQSIYILSSLSLKFHKLTALARGYEPSCNLQLQHTTYISYHPYHLILYPPGPIQHSYFKNHQLRNCQELINAQIDPL
jgi:hypothetical protein